MSYSFYISVEHPPTFSQLFEAFPQLSLEDSAPEDDQFAVDYYYHVYENHVTVRSLEIGISKEDSSMPVFSIRIMTASSLADYELALDIAEFVAKHANSKIQGEDSDSLDLENFRIRFGSDWIQHMVRSGPTALRRMIKGGDYSGPLQLTGTRRPLYFGVDSLAKIDNEDESTFLENYFELARRVQYIEEDGFYAATQMQMRNKDPEKQVIFSVWGPGVDYLFPDVDFISVLSEEIIIIPIGLLDVFTKVEFIDDRHRIAEKVDEKDWDDIVAQAQKHKIDPTNPPN